MLDSTTSDPRLVMRWIPVVDASGRARLESCWLPTAQAAQAAPRADAHAA